MDAAIDEVPEPAPRTMRPATNMPTSCAQVIKTTPMILRTTEMKTPVLRPTRSTTGPMKVETMAHPRKDAAELSDLVAVVRFKVVVYDGRMLMPLLQTVSYSPCGVGISGRTSKLYRSRLSVEQVMSFNTYAAGRHEETYRREDARRQDDQEYGSPAGLELEQAQGPIEETHFCGICAMLFV